MPLYIGMWLAFVAVVIVNAFSNLLPINGQTIAEISDRIEVLFKPAGYVFSIWLVIYVTLAIWLVLQWKKVKEDSLNGRVGVAFIISCLFNIGWIFSWHYEFFMVSILMMFGLLLSLITIYLQYRRRDRALSERFPFSLYLAWITVATVSNVSYVLKYYDVSLGLSEVIGSLMLVAIASVIAFVAATYSWDYYFVLVVVWALIGIIVENSNLTMQIATGVITAVLVVAVILSAMGRKSRQRIFS